MWVGLAEVTGAAPLHSNNLPFTRTSYPCSPAVCPPADKPDLRYGLEMAEVTEAVRGCGFRYAAHVCLTNLMGRVAGCTVAR